MAKITTDVRGVEIAAHVNAVRVSIVDTQTRLEDALKRMNETNDASVKMEILAQFNRETAEQTREVVNSANRLRSYLRFLPNAMDDKLIYELFTRLADKEGRFDSIAHKVNSARREMKAKAIARKKQNAE